MKEIWKSIHNYEKIYEISNLGRLRSINRIVQRKKMGKLQIGD